jgi:hypothetical protein
VCPPPCATCHAIHWDAGSDGLTDGTNDEVDPGLGIVPTSNTPNSEDDESVSPDNLAINRPRSDSSSEKKGTVAIIAVAVVGLVVLVLLVLLLCCLARRKRRAEWERRQKKREIQKQVCPSLVP